MADAQPRRRVIKKVAGGHGHHGGAWKVAYADFVTAMMALFMVMWLLSATDQKSRKEIAQYFRTGILPSGDMAMDHAAQITPSVMEVAPAPPPPDQATLDDEAEAVESKIQAMAAMNAELSSLLANVTVRDTPAGLLIDIADEGDRQLLFEPSSSKLKPALQTFLSLLGPMLGRERNQLEINGHTDARPFASGAITSNWDLSFERANQARQILEANGLRPGQVGGVVGRGSSDPHDPKQPYAASNRRLSVLLVRRPSRSAPAKSPATPATEASGSGASVDPDRDTKWPYGSTFLIGK